MKFNLVKNSGKIKKIPENITNHHFDDSGLFDMDEVSFISKNMNNK